MSFPLIYLHASFILYFLLLFQTFSRSFFEALRLKLAALFSCSCKPKYSLDKWPIKYSFCCVRNKLEGFHVIFLPIISIVFESACMIFQVGDFRNQLQNIENLFTVPSSMDLYLSNYIKIFLVYNLLSRPAKELIPDRLILGIFTIYMGNLLHKNRYVNYLELVCHIK